MRLRSNLNHCYHLTSVISLLLIVLFTTSQSIATTNSPVWTAEEEAFIASHGPVRVHVEDNWPPFNYIEYGEVKGYVNDYMKLLAERTGIQIEFVTGYRWSDYIEMLQDGRIDVISNMKITPDRQTYALFSQRSIVYTVQGILSHKNVKQVNTLAELQQSGMSVAVVKGYFQQELFKRHYPDVNLLLTNDTTDSIRQVINGKADVAIATHSVFDHYINKHFYSGLRNTPITDDPLISKTGQFIGMRKSLPALKSIIDKGMASISDEEIFALRKKWSGDSSDINANKTPSMLLSAEEQTFLAQKKVITMCVDPDWMPLEAIENGRHVGMSAEFMNFFQKQLGTPIQLIPTDSWSQSVNYAKDRRCDIFSMVMFSPSRKDYIDFTTPYLHIPLIMATRMDEIYIASVSTITHPVGIVRDYASAELLRSKYPGMNIIDVDSVDDGLSRIQKGEIYGFIGTLNTVGYAIQNGYPELKIAGKFEDILEFGVGVRNDEPLLLSSFNKVISVLPPNQQRKIVSNWSSVRYEQSFDYSLLWKILIFVLLIIGGLMYRQRVLKSYNTQLRHISMTDPLTNCANRLHLDEFLQYQVKRYARYQEEFSIILCDLDRFKSVNDTFGHLVGDKVLIDFVALIKRSLRSTDLVGRWGGEEFLIICPNTKAAGALKIAEDLRKHTAENNFPEAGTVTASFGVTCYSDEKESTTSLMKRVDKALYQAKDSGRNKTMLL